MLVKPFHHQLLRRSVVGIGEKSHAMALDYGVEIWRTAIQVIQACGKETDAKAYAFGKASELHDKGDMAEAERWARSPMPLIWR
jgi:hypothetical protein